MFGRVGFFQGAAQITHPEIELRTKEIKEGKSFLEPVYPSTEKLNAKGLGGRQIGKLTWGAFYCIYAKLTFRKTLPDAIINKLQLSARFRSFEHIHFPPNFEAYEKALERLKFEELLMAQLRMGLIKSQRHRHSKGILFSHVGDNFNNFYKGYLPFELTGAQKRVLKEIRNDTAQGKQMNRLLQGDVGSGKTIVALLTMLLAVDNGYQACLMAPTEILVNQHFDNISELLKEMDVTVALLTGSTKKKERTRILKELEDGSLQLLIGTHALIEDAVKFKQLGLVIVDEQHRFGVAQRARMWEKAIIPPHVLVMTATPIPRTLALTAYGDLDYSVIDELPPGQKAGNNRSPL